MRRSWRWRSDACHSWYTALMSSLSLDSPFVPTTGPFRRGEFVKGVLSISERRWMAAIICWTIGITAIAGMLLSKAYPKAQYALDKDQMSLMPLIAFVFGIVGAIIALWSRRIVIDIALKRVKVSRGFSLLRVSQTVTCDKLWLEVHPIKTRVGARNRAVAWNGFAAVLHTDTDAGVVLAADAAKEAADNVARDWAARTSITFSDTLSEEAKLIEAVG